MPYIISDEKKRLYQENQRAKARQVAFWIEHPLHDRFVEKVAELGMTKQAFLTFAIRDYIDKTESQHD